MSDDERKGSFYIELPTPSGTVQPTQFPGVRIVHGYTIPTWAEPETDVRIGTCRGCGVEMGWVVTKAGKSAPIDKDGTNHFATCPVADRFRKK